MYPRKGLSRRVKLPVHNLVSRHEMPRIEVLRLNKATGFVC
ncbi:unannotated protein [freshwater metagenome]|uniref:Unannotated protein n=1 Tax=freshwater metagenome TaxID=449393 RepID=A0A6J6ZJH1_9ZZZZ